ncbi:MULTISPECIES: hypothetical protein [Rhodomicrobium]|uniref:hypothetical protein n=1 Tax=Rhodomicrobium TaxID=1068 RepID=UPI000B4BF6E4|nr:MULTISPECIES: hypothetical protein [Rhodomicrobium]
MGRHLSCLLAALIVSAFALLAPASAEAASYPTAFAPALSEASFLKAGYYGGYREDKSYDDYDRRYDDDNGDDGDEYKYKRRYHHCGGAGYRQKYVCENNEPRCFRQRECIWYFGREYCRYVRKCVGGEKYCKWITVPSGYNSCD